MRSLQHLQLACASSLVFIALSVMHCTGSSAPSGMGGDGGPPSTSPDQDASAPQVQCPDDMRECNPTPSATDCETKVRFDAKNCGACGRTCSDGECRNFTCVAELITPISPLELPSAGFASARIAVVLQYDDRVRYFSSNRGLYELSLRGGEPKLLLPQTTGTLLHLARRGDDTLISFQGGCLIEDENCPGTNEDSWLVEVRSDGSSREIGRYARSDRKVVDEIHLLGDDVVTFGNVPPTAGNSSHEQIAAVIDVQTGEYRWILREPAHHEGRSPSTLITDPSGPRLVWGEREMLRTIPLNELGVVLTSSSEYHVTNAHGGKAGFGGESWPTFRIVPSPYGAFLGNSHCALTHGGCTITSTLASGAYDFLWSDETLVFRFAPAEYQQGDFIAETWDNKVDVRRIGPTYRPRGDVAVLDGYVYWFSGQLQPGGSLPSGLFRAPI